MTNDSVLITGGTGFIGHHLVNRWLQQGMDITVLSRRPQWVQAQWGGRVAAVTTPEQLSGRFTLLVNLAGEGIAERRWSDARRQQLYDSRVTLTRELAVWARNSGQRFRAVLSGSAVGYYGAFSGEQSSPLDELAPAGDDFAARLCRDWEEAAAPLAALSERLLLLRTGVVLGADGGMLKKLRLPFSLGLGGVIGDGRQILSWIHLQDYLRAVDYLLQSELSGAVNMTAPQPVSNRGFTQTLAAALQRPALVPLPAFAARLLLGEMSELLLKGQYAEPVILDRSSFRFHFPGLSAALADLV